MNTVLGVAVVLVATLTGHISWKYPSCPVCSHNLYTERMALMGRRARLAHCERHGLFTVSTGKPYFSPGYHY